MHARFPVPLTALRPPYEAERPYPSADSQLPPGSLLIVHVGPAQQPSTTRRISEFIRKVRRDLGVAVLLRTVTEVPDGLPPPGVVELLAAGAGGWIPPRADPLGVALRWLPCPSDLAADWLGWMRLRRPLEPRAAAYLESIIRNAAGHGSVVKLLRAQSISPRTVRRVLARDDLPPPGRWLRAARLLESQLTLQRDRELTLNAVAFSLGYAEAASYSNQHRRVFGVGAGAGRKLLGREWRYAAFWRRLARSEQR